MTEKAKKLRRKRLIKRGWKTLEEERNTPVRITRDMIQGEEVIPNPQNNPLVE